MQVDPERAVDRGKDDLIDKATYSLERVGLLTAGGNAARGTGILNNPLYIGKLVWNKLRYVKDPDTRKRRSKANKAEAQ